MVNQILIVDDRAVVRKELRHLLELIGTVAVIGEAEDGWDAIRKAKILNPDTVLMDLEMPGMDGFEAIRQIKALRLAKIVIAFTVYTDVSYRQKAMEAGADAFIEKGTDLQTLIDVINHLSQPDDIVDPI